MLTGLRYNCPEAEADKLTRGFAVVSKVDGPVVVAYKFKELTQFTEDEQEDGFVDAWHWIGMSKFFALCQIHQHLRHRRL